MNVYQKLNEARVKLQTSDIKKTGKNKHLGFEYFELADFLQVINQINNEIGICTAFKVFDAKAELHVFNAEKPDEVIVFESPTAHAKLQGNASAIQELGSQHTYMRRYLYLMAYEIIENDAQDAQIGAQQEKTQKPSNNPLVEEKHTKAIYASYKAKGIADDVIKTKIKKDFSKEHSKDLTIKEFKMLMDWIKAQPDKEVKND